MLTVVDLRGDRADPVARLPRATVDREAARASVREVIAAVRARGDDGAQEQQERFGIARAPLRVPAEEIERARVSCPPGLAAAMELAAARILAFHERQLAEERAGFWRSGADGALVGEETAPIRRVGCLVPGGAAPLASTVLMTVLPARVAGVTEIAVCATPQHDGHVHPVTLAACAVAGVSEVYALGGPAAVGALAYGTQSVPPVDLIVGPGSIWTTIAKHEVAMDVGIDLYAGPTEVVIVADDTAPPRAVAADLVAQAEHDPLATALLVTPSERLVEAVQEALGDEVARASRRDEISKAIAGQGRAVLVEDLTRALEVVNALAPEHVELMCEEADRRAREVRTAGALFVGPSSPVALGDYVAGTNHVLPTGGAARFSSPLRVSNFIRTTAVIAFDRSGLEQVGPALVALAEAEGLDAHARALRVRLEEDA